VPILIIQAFLKTKADWILEKLAQVKPLSQSAHNKKVIFLEHKEKALKIIQDKVEVLNKVYGFAYGNITIRDQRSRWGSCSKRGDLSFNYRLVLLPERLLGYVVVHELCHLKEFNHSRAFWDLVALGDPDYLLHKKELKKEGLRMQ
jgi:predicted metal-dependent hydrolase